MTLTNITTSGLVDAIEASDQITLTRIERQMQLGRTITVDYDEVANRIVSDVEVRGSSPATSWAKVRDAVWDTGSMTSAIDEGLAHKLGLTKVDETAIATMTGVAKANQYFIDVRIARGMVLRSMRVNGVDLSGRPDGMRVLLGMDVISLGRLTVDTRRGVTTMEFSMPEE